MLFRSFRYIPNTSSLIFVFFVFTSTELSTEFPGAIDAYTVTYEKGDISYTLTQPTVTRNASGAVTAQPDIIITKN